MTLMMALIIGLAAVTGGAAAASWDTETTTTTTESDLTGAPASFTISPESSGGQNVYVETQGASSSDLTLEISPTNPDVDTTLYSTSNFSTEDDANGHYSVELTQAELEENLPRAVGPNPYTIEILNSSGDVVLENQGVELMYTSGDTLVVLGDDSTGTSTLGTPLLADGLTVEETDSFLPEFLAGDDNGSSVASLSTQMPLPRDIANGSDAVISLDNQQTRDAFDAAAADADDGEAIDATASINSEPVQVFAVGAAPEDVEDAYLSYNADNGDLTVESNGDEDLESANSAFVTAEAGDGGYGPFSEFGVFSFDSFDFGDF